MKKIGIGAESLELKYMIKPLSVNECWQGQRYKTKLYKNYEFELRFWNKKKDIINEDAYNKIFQKLSDYSGNEKGG